METSLSSVSALTSMCSWRSESFSKKNSVHLRSLNCVRSGARDNSDIYEDQSIDKTETDVWKLFNEAKKNILFLNEQRLLAAAALGNEKKLKEELIDKIEKMATENKKVVFWDLLHRIDAMVLIGLIGVEEASTLRKVVVNFTAKISEALSENLQKSDAELLSALRSFSTQCQRRRFHIVHVCTEMSPLVAEGALAAYVSGVSRALHNRGHLVEVILPKYASIDFTKIHNLRKIEVETYSYYDGQLYGNAVWTGVVHGVGVTFIDPLQYSSFFRRENIYGYSDDFERFSYFSRASLDYLVKSGKQPDVLHLHNCETAVIGPLFWDIFVHKGLKSTKILLTIHGFNSQFLVTPEKLALCGLDPSSLHRPDRFQDDDNQSFANILKGGIVYSNKVMIASTTNKVKTLHTLQPTVITHKEKVVDTQYGMDDFEWDPSCDKLLPSNYTFQDMKGKAICKTILQQQLNLAQDSPAVLVVCSLSGLMNFDVKIGTQIVFLESNDVLLESLSKELKDGSVSHVSESDVALSHLLISGADILLCESYEDPVNQLPMKALKYGTAPLALGVNKNGVSGKLTECMRFSFGGMSLDDALYEIRNEPLRWQQKIADGMRKDFSWDALCADDLVAAYETVTKI